MIPISASDMLGNTLYGYAHYCGKSYTAITDF